MCMIKIFKNPISIEGLTGTCTGFIAHGHVTPECDKKINRSTRGKLLTFSNSLTNFIT